MKAISLKDLEEPMMSERSGGLSPEEALRDPDFQNLARRKNRISLVLMLVTMSAFYGFVYLLGWHSDWLAQSWSGSINRGIPLGIGVIVLCWVLTGVYVRWANSQYDAMVARIKTKMKLSN